MKKPVICPVALPTDLAGEDSLANRSEVVTKLVESLLFIREQTDRPFHEESNKETGNETGSEIGSGPELKNKNKSIRGGMKERKRTEFVSEMEEILSQIERVISDIRLKHVIEIVIAIGANICNPKELWRFKLGDIDRNTGNETGENTGKSKLKVNQIKIDNQNPKESNKSLEN